MSSRPDEGEPALFGKPARVQEGLSFLRWNFGRPFVLPVIEESGE